MLRTFVLIPVGPLRDVDPVACADDRILGSLVAPDKARASEIPVAGFVLIESSEAASEDEDVDTSVLEAFVRPAIDLEDEGPVGIDAARLIGDGTAILVDIGGLPV